MSGGEEILSLNQRKPPQLDRYLCFYPKTGAWRGAEHLLPQLAEMAIVKNNFHLPPVLFIEETRYPLYLESTKLQSRCSTEQGLRLLGNSLGLYCTYGPTVPTVLRYLRYLLLNFWSLGLCVVLAEAGLKRGRGQFLNVIQWFYNAKSVFRAVKASLCWLNNVNGVYLVLVYLLLIGQQGLGHFFKYRPLLLIGWRILQILLQRRRNVNSH
jgi:hypothetical protein